MILTTNCYLKRDGKTLMLHRVKKANDVNEGKWIGVGGKMEGAETPLECITREVREETGYQLHSARLHGFVVFPGILHGEDEGMFVYTSDDFSGEMIACDEGVLAWIPDEDVLSLPMWEGDYHLHEWLRDDLFHVAKITYENDRVVYFRDETQGILKDE